MAPTCHLAGGCRAPDLLHTVRATRTPLLSTGAGTRLHKSTHCGGSQSLGRAGRPSAALLCARRLPEGAFLADPPGQQSKVLVRRDEFISAGQVPALHILPQMGWEKEGASWRQREREAFPSTSAPALQSGRAQGRGSGAPHPPGSSSQRQRIPNSRRCSARSTRQRRWESPNDGSQGAGGSGSSSSAAFGQRHA